MTTSEFRTLRGYFYRVFTKLATTGEETKARLPKGFCPELKGLKGVEYNRKYCEIRRDSVNQKRREYYRRNKEQRRKLARLSHKRNRDKRVKSINERNFKRKYGDFAEVAELTNELHKRIIYGQKSSIKKVS